MSINQQIPDIKKKINELKIRDSDCENFGADMHQYKLNPAIKENIVETFERVHDISLPESYRLFITNIGDGGAGPCYGLYSFQKAIELSVDVDAGVWLADEFPLTNLDVDNYFRHCQQCEDEGEIDLIKKITMPDPLPGILCLAEYGCNCFYILVVNGEQRDTVWLIDGDNNTITPIVDDNNKQRNFIDWYGSWLDHHLDDSSSSKPSWDRNTKTINYDGWRLNKIPGEILECQNVRSLIFSRNELKKYPEEITCFSQLRTLDLSMNPLKSVSPSIARLTKLRRLLINYSDITSLPDELANLQLEEFSCYYNYKMKKLPSVVGKLSTLKKLILSNAYELSEIPDIGELQELRFLDLSSSSKIQFLPESICTLRNLQRLYIGETAITKLPNGFDQLRNLISLEINADELDLQDAVGKIKDLPKLHYLCISNQLSYPENFSSLLSIKHLRITQNYNLWRKGKEKFSVPEQISGIPNLEILEFDKQNDQFTELPDNIGDLICLRELYLPRLSRFPESLKNLRNLSFVQGYKENLSDQEINKLKSWHPHCDIQIW